MAKGLNCFMSPISSIAITFRILTSRSCSHAASHLPTLWHRLEIWIPVAIMLLKSGHRCVLHRVMLANSFHSGNYLRCLLLQKL